MGYETSDYKVFPVRAAAVLTNTYVAGTVIGEAQEYNQYAFEIQFTLGSLTSADIKLEFSEDNSTWYQETFSSISGGTDTLTLGIHRLTSSGNYVLNCGMLSRYYRISVIGNGTVTSSSMAIQAVMGRD